VISAFLDTSQFATPLLNILHQSNIDNPRWQHLPILQISHPISKQFSLPIKVIRLIISKLSCLSSVTTSKQTESSYSQETPIPKYVWFYDGEEMRMFLGKKISVSTLALLMTS
jgi:hypothetical protein